MSCVLADTIDAYRDALRDGGAFDVQDVIQMLANASEFVRHTATENKQLRQERQLFAFEQHDRAAVEAEIRAMQTGWG